MPLEISYWSIGDNENVYGREISAESLALTGTSALSAVTPAGADIVRIETTEAARISYTGAAGTAAATTPYLAANAIIELDAVAGWKVAGKTA